MQLSRAAKTKLREFPRAISLVWWVGGGDRVRYISGPSVGVRVTSLIA